MVKRTRPPLVSCLMVTADRLRLARRSLLSFSHQTYENKELIIVDDGEEDYGPLLEEFALKEVKYIKIKKNPANLLGTLRNLSLQKAKGDFITQWDDDDWYHPDRIRLQVECLIAGFDACCLSNTLMHLDHERYFYHPFISLFRRGTPGSIMHRYDPSILYPAMRKAEDDAYLTQWMKKRYTRLPSQMAYLMVRFFHGSNTWDLKHFQNQMTNTFKDRIAHIWFRYIKRDLFRHPRFQLDPPMKDSFDLYLRDSYRADLFQRPGDK